MSLSKQEESALLHVYDTYWHSYLTGDISTLASLLSDDYTQIGSVETEVFDNKKDAVHFIETTIDQIAGNLEMRNRVKKIEPVDPFMLITEHCDLYVLTEGDWVFYARFRASSFLQKKEGQWKFIHQHSSMPDIRAEEGENIATEKISRENIELRDAIKRRTIELEQKNQELAMEASLERVRTVAMGMRKPDDLPGICEVLFNELRSMGFIELRNAMINIHNDEKSTFVNYDYSEEIGPSINHLNYTIHPVIEKQIKQIRSTHDAFSETVFSGQDLADWKAFRKRIGEKDDPRIDHVDALYYYFYSIGTGAIGISTFGPISAGKLDQLKRFRNVFEFAYRRYIDVAQAEAQVKESQIQLALERVRAKTMSMQKSEELKDVAKELRVQMAALGTEELETCAINLYEVSDDYMEAWVAIRPPQSPKEIVEFHYNIPKKGIYIIEDMISAYLTGVDEFLFELTGPKGAQWMNTMETSMPEMFAAAAASDNFKITGDVQAWFTCDYFSGGGLIMITMSPPLNESRDLLKRFKQVFGLAYRRFADLKKAEAQAKEALIETALERVRSRTMGMQKSEELKEVIKVVYDQFVHLQINIEHTGFIIEYKEKDDMHIWLADRHMVPSLVTIPYFDSPHWNSFIEAKEKGKDFFANQLNFEEKNRFYQTLFEIIPGVPKETKEFYFACPGLAISTVLLDHIGLYIENFSGIPYNDEENIILMRFGKVFEQAYIRFNDLKQAEGQAREARIEAALERVRSRAMAMQKSSELSILIEQVYRELGLLDMILQRCFIMIFDPINSNFTWWMASNEEGSSQREYLIQYHENKPHLAYIKGWQEQNAKWEYTLQGTEKKEWDEFLFKETELVQLPPQIIANMTGTPCAYLHSSFSHFGCICAASVEPLMGDHFEIINRFSKVFDQCYTRFLDLQKAETQAKEATIEAALEKVRGKAMAMHNSSDLEITAGMVFTELRKLGITPMRCGVSIQNKENRNILYYSASASEKGDNLSLVGSALLEDHPVLISIYDHWILGEDYFPVLKGDELKTYYEKIQSHFSIPVNAQKDYVQYGYYLPFSEGLFYGWSDQPFKEEEIKILRRFTSIIDLTFRRYVELKKSEANALDAIRRASLDRVRAETASMRTTADLEKITPMIWNELSTLGVPFIRCGVFIMDEEQELIHTFLSTPDGKAIASFHLPYKASADLWETVIHWRKKQNYQQHWDESAFAEWTNNLIQQGFITSSDSYATEHRPTNLYLHFLPFMQGMLYVGNVAALNENDLHLVQNLADAFSTAYARYEDFNRLEAAKEQVDKTLKDLKQAQSQLVQAEKMASLGELTAGIAHEIQNPLNFVNNFSEINMELSDEIVEAARKGNLEEIIQLAGGIKSNQNKINEHGKRADAIVKGMLQHSRSSSGIKEPTDINKLADEYLRLAYHGLRAKDKTFNATLHTNFDPTIGKIPIMPQDIGRVLLNLYNNAFYAVAEKKQLFPTGYEPEVSVCTKRIGDKIKLSVKDNGMGIPKKVLDKIFQPFFTTKPTGQGTGLGLSLSYDIVKAHAGELRVETKEGEGSEFLIQLPIV